MYLLAVAHPRITSFVSFFHYFEIFGIEVTVTFHARLVGNDEFPVGSSVRVGPEISGKSPLRAVPLDKE